MTGSDHIGEVAGKLRLTYLIFKLTLTRQICNMNFVSERSNKFDGFNVWIYRWLILGCMLVMTMVVIGGITRLTGSGLSMTKWSVFGTTPPLSAEKWEMLFDQYKQSPEFQQINTNFTLGDFKNIFWWEFVHRFLGRTIGIVFIIPFIWFAIRKQLPAGYFGKLLLLLGLGGMQGVFGWIMVKSGLNKVPHVSHYLLALHLATAFTTFGYTFWLALGLIRSRNSGGQIPAQIKSLVRMELLLVSLQIVYGAFVAGLKAGWYYPQFPMMGDYWLPPDATHMSPAWKNVLENPVGVQFIHRVIATLIVINTIALFVAARKAKLSDAFKRGLQLLTATVAVQFTLGVITLLLLVPVFTASLHQVGAFFLLGITIYLLFEQCKLSNVENRIGHHHETDKVRAGDKTNADTLHMFSLSGIGNNVSHSERKYEPKKTEDEQHNCELFLPKLHDRSNNTYDLKYIL